MRGLGDIKYLIQKYTGEDDNGNPSGTGYLGIINQKLVADILDIAATIKEREKAWSDWVCVERHSLPVNSLTLDVAATPHRAGGWPGASRNLWHRFRGDQCPRGGFLEAQVRQPGGEAQGTRDVKGPRVDLDQVHQPGHHPVSQH